MKGFKALVFLVTMASLLCSCVSAGANHSGGSGNSRLKIPLLLSDPEKWVSPADFHARKRTAPPEFPIVWVIKIMVICSAAVFAYCFGIVVFAVISPRGFRRYEAFLGRLRVRITGTSVYKHIAAIRVNRTAVKGFIKLMLCRRVLRFTMRLAAGVWDWESAMDIVLLRLVLYMFF